LAGALNCYDFQRPRQVFFMGDYFFAGASENMRHQEATVGAAKSVISSKLWLLIN
jgi:hypothetical protein